MNRHTLRLGIGLALMSTATATPPTWSDEFNGSGPADPAIWSYEQGYQRNNELQYYTSNNGWQENGMFVIEARQEVTVDGQNTYNYTSSSIISKNNYSFLYGRAQIRAKVPALSGMWPAIWTVGDVGTWPHNGECDIMEYYQNKILANCAVGTDVKWGAKWDSSSRTMTSLEAVDPDWKNKFHIWTMQWDESNVRLYCDNILMNTIPQSWLVNGKTGGQVGGAPLEPFKQPHSLWLNLAVGGNGGGSVGNTSFPQRYYIDYWRVWEGATGNVAPTDIALTVSSVNESLPVGTVVGDLAATDADPAEVIRYSLVAGAGDDHNAQFSIPEFVSDNTLIGSLKTAAVLNYDDGATRSIRVRATDIEGATYEKVFTITVVPDPDVVVSVSSLEVPEGGTQVLSAKLRYLPASNITVNVSRSSGDSDLGVAAGATLTFTPTNGTTWQQVTLAAAEDADITNGSATFLLEDPSGQFASAVVTASEVENDNLSPVVDAGLPQTVYLTGSGGGAVPTPGADVFLDAGLDDGANAIWEDSLGLWSPTIDAQVTHIANAGSSLSGITSSYDFPGGLLGLGGCRGAGLATQGVNTLPITLELWFKPDASASYPANGQVLWETGGGTGMGIFYNNGVVETAHDSHQGLISANVGALTGEFIQAVVTYDPLITSNNFKLYINGVLAATGSRNDPNMCGGDDAGLGKRGQSNVGGAGGGDANTVSFDGQIALFRAYHNQILTATEVQANYDAVAGEQVQVFLDGDVTDPNGEPTTVAWTLVSGPASVTFANAGSVDTMASFGVVGTYILRLTADDGTSVPGFDEVVITVGNGGGGGDTTPPVLLGSGIVDNRSGADVTPGTLVTYTVSFNEDMNAATVDASDFSNAGTSSVTIGSVTETSPGVFAVGVTPTTEGTLQLQVPASAVLTDVAGNALDTSSAIVDDTTILVISGPVNNLPVFTSDPIAGADATEDAAYSGSIAGSATDADPGDVLSYSKVSGPAWLSVASNGGLSGTPANSNVGLNAFTVSVNDGNGGSDTATLNITVLNTNDTPVFTVDPISGADAIATAAYSGTIAGSASDEDGNALTYAKVSGPAWLSVASNGALSGTPASGDVGLNAFTVSVTDSIAAPVTATLNINVVVAGGEEVVPLATVFAHNERDNFTGIPFDLINGSGMNGNPDTGVAGWPSGAGLPSTWVATSNAYQAEHQSRDFLLAQTPSEDLDPYGVLLPAGVGPTNGKVGWYVIDIGQVTTGLKDLHIWHIREVANRIAANFNIYIAETPTVAVPHGPTGTNARDYDFASGGWTPVATGVAGIYRGVTVTPLNGASARYIGLEIMANGGATDERVGFAEVGLTRISGASNAAPTWTADPVIGSDANEDAAYAGTLAGGATDAESDPLTFAKVSGPAWLSVAADGTLSGTPTNADVGANVFTVSVTDSINPAVNATLNITVVNTNDAPVFAADPINGGDATADVAYAGSIAGSAVDDDGNVLAYAKVSGPAWLSVAADGTLSGTPANADVGTNAFMVSVTDSIAAPVNATLNITVNAAANNAPEWTVNPVNEINATEDSAYASTLANDAADAESDPLAFAKVSGPAWLSVAADGTLSGTPTNADVGANAFTVSVSDSINPAVNATLNITVVNTNDAPVFAADPINGGDATEGVVYAGSIAGSAVDDDGDTLAYAKLSGPAWLSVAADGSLSGTPASGDVGANVFTVSADDGNGGVDTAILNITVNPPPPSMKLVRTVVAGVSNTAWTTVSLGQSYDSLVVVATPIHAPGVTVPVVTRINNITASGFDLKLDRVDGLSAAVSFDVSVVAVEEGVYTAAVDGVTMEAVKYTSTITAYGASNWTSEARSYQNSYTTPVVIGQVMSSNDSRWSVFWSMGATRQVAADAGNLNVGKHVGQDPVKTRASEVIGYIVIESGSGTIDGVAYEAGLGPAAVQSFGDSATPYSYSLSGGLGSVSTAAVSQSGMVGNDGAWAVLSGSPYVTTTSLRLHVAEDEFKDSRKKHAAERVGYIVFE